MGRLSLAWRILVNGEFAAKIQTLMTVPALPVAEKKTDGVTVPRTASEVPVRTESKPASPTRSDAVTLLSTLQREGRLIDFLKESIDGYSDAQIGAAVRDIHRDCAASLERQFAIRPVLEQSEGSAVQISTEATSSGRIRLTGRVSNETPESGVLAHHGWQVTCCEVPVWTGDSSAAAVIAAAEVEIR